MANFEQVRHYLGMAEEYCAALDARHEEDVRQINELNCQLDFAIDMLSRTLYGSRQKAQAAIKRECEKAS